MIAMSVTTELMIVCLKPYVLAKLTILRRNVTMPAILDKTFRHIKVRISENHNVSPRIGKLATGNLFIISILSII